VGHDRIDAAPSHYALPDPLLFSAQEASSAASLRTHLNPFSVDEQRLLLRAVYAGADTSLRARGLANNNPIAKFNFDD
jgi:NTE family protein